MILAESVKRKFIARKTAKILEATRHWHEMPRMAMKMHGWHLEFAESVCLSGFYGPFKPPLALKKRQETCGAAALGHF